MIWRASVRSGYKALCFKRAGKKAPTFVEDIKALFDENVHKLLMTPPFLTLTIFTIIPLFYMILMAFTNYSKVDEHLILFDWVGMDNFISLFDSSSTIGSQFWDVLQWTIIWAFFATFLNFFAGTIMAMIINRPTTRLKGLWRTVFSLTIAVPQFVSLLIIRTMLKDDGAVNRLLWSLGLVENGVNLPFWTNATWAKVVIIVVNLWVGIPYTVMQVTGILILTGLISRLGKYLPAQSISGFLFVIGLLMTFAPNLTSVAAADGSMSGYIALGVTAWSKNPFLGMVAGIIVKFFGSYLGL